MLVGVLFAAVCVDSVHITVKDAEKAIDTAWLLYARLCNGELRPSDVHNSEWKVDLEGGGTMPAYCEIKDGAMNCGIPDMYLLPNSNFNTLSGWFTNTRSTTFGGSGVVRVPKRKPNGVYKANAFYRNSPYLFNFHIPIDMNSEVLTLLKLLLARLK